MPILNVLTNAGINMILSGLASGQVVTFTKVRIGYGIPQQASIAALRERTSLVSAHPESIGVPKISSRKIDTSGNLIISTAYSNAQVTSSITITELGVFAKLGTGTEKLFSYLYFGDAADTILPATTATITRTYDIPYTLGGSSGGTSDNVTVTIDPTTLVPASDVSETSGAGNIPRADQSGRLRFDTTGTAGSVWNSGKTKSYDADSLVNADNMANFAATSDKAGTMTPAHVADLNTAKGYLDQSVKRSASPTFAGLTVNGYIDGAKFR